MGAIEERATGCSAERMKGSRSQAPRGQGFSFLVSARAYCIRPPGVLRRFVLPKTYFVSGRTPGRT